MTGLVWLLVWGIVISALAFRKVPLEIWTLSLGVILAVFTRYADAPVILTLFMWAAFLLIMLPLNFKPLRQKYISEKALELYKKAMPNMSSTEREALEAGTVSWEGELFTGRPQWKKLFSYRKPKLSAEEQAFINGPVKQLCKMIDDWDITHKRGDIPPQVWQFIKDNGFFGLIIPKEHGGREFSAFAHTQILTMIYGVSATVATTVSVPNSLGPAELLLKYGTDEQKTHYLPRLARGEDVPCFALTGPDAGSDATAMTDTGVVCRGEYHGEQVIGIKLNFNKRYITLAPVATVIGLAFKLQDPEHLLGDEQKTDYGITCALIPRDTAGVTIGRRHYPASAVFQNGPIQGEDVFIPVDSIIGGQEMAGQGWRMLMECLACGRAVSLPSAAIGGAKTAVAATTAYSRIRRQFNLPIGKFEGIQEVIARMGGLLYISDAARIMTAGLIDNGEEPSVPSAIVKYHTTEMARIIGNDACDVHGGKAVCLGPKNYLARGYQAIPISITVEGANILTRCLIIFGQGAVRCHPYVFAQMTAAKCADKKQAVKLFDAALFGHMGFTITSMIKALSMGLTRSVFIKVPDVPGCKRYLQHFTRYSAVFTSLVDMAMLLLGGTLKRKEQLSGRFADLLSLLYLGSATIKRYNDNGKPKDELPLVQWSCDYILYQLQQQTDSLLRNFPNRVLGLALRVFIFPLGRRFAPPSDKLTQQVAKLLQHEGGARDRLLEACYLEPEGDNMVGHMQVLMNKVDKVIEIEKRLRKAKEAGEIEGEVFGEMVVSAWEKEIITQDEMSELMSVDKGRQQVIAVDDFASEDLMHNASADTTSHAKINKETELQAVE